MTSRSELIKQLADYGITVNGAKVCFPGKINPQAIPLLRQLKLSQADTWDGGQALNIWQEMLDRMRVVYPAGALPWCNRQRPDLIEKLNAIGDRYTEVFHKRDINEVREAAALFEGVLSQIITTYQEDYNNEC
ncbi:hypothetical protein Psch_02188 [Pelotomaculum schinkii]|uniref:Uncharacterized protein n=1 Tax=Pelotomaculum schinkii TaxID=78350 RepID=A0A4Y7RIU0_9FIRM|nr:MULTISPECIES: hypothetical protein [Pelotomaculum]TEB08622.1 hypothetical protein Psch_02188 [Pelotomaculum schinkii]TEB16817.1 hypothetical protein Psfp_00979 [Pelotomaculum sp. FP]